MTMRDPVTRLLRLAAWVCTLALGGCGILGPQVCTLEFVYGVSIDAVDAITRQPVTAGLSGTLSEGSYREDMEVFGNHLAGAGERKGRYSAAIAATGYRVWLQDDIRVGANDCHVEPVRIEAALIRL